MGGADRPDRKPAVVLPDHCLGDIAGGGLGGELPSRRKLADRCECSSIPFLLRWLIGVARMARAEASNARVEFESLLLHAVVV